MKNLFSLLIFCSFYVSSFTLCAESNKNASTTDLSVLLDSANKALQLSQIDQSLALLYEIEPLLNDKTSDDQLFKYLFIKASSKFQTWQLKDAEKSYLEALALATKLQDTTKILVSYSGLSNTFSAQAKHREAIQYQEWAMKYAGAADSSTYYALHANIALSHINALEYELGLKYLIIAKDYYSRSEKLQELALIENNIGELYREHLKNPDLALGHYLKAYKINRDLNLKGQLVQVTHNMGLIHSENDNLDSAFYYTNLSLNLRKETGDMGGLAISHHSLGDIYLKQKDYDQAISQFVKTVEISAQYGIPQGEFYGNTGLGNVNRALGRTRSAQALYQKAKVAADQIGAVNLQIDIRKIIFETYKENRQYQEALQAHEAYISFSDSIEANRDNQQLLEMQVRYETNLSKAENALLKKESEVQTANIEMHQFILFGQVALLIIFLGVGLYMRRIIRQRNQAYRSIQDSQEKLELQYLKVLEQGEGLKSANELKNKIFSVLGHDLRSPLANIASMLGMISVENISREELKNVKDQLRQEIESSLKTLQNILEWSRIEMNDVTLNRKYIDVTPLLQNVAEIFESSLQLKNISLEIPNVPPDILWADENQFRSIATNLISNAIKFSPEKGQINIYVSALRDGVIFSVRDQGDGIQEDVLNELNSKAELITRLGTLGEKGTGIGLRIVKDFALAHGGQFRLINASEGGACAIVDFPNPDKLTESASNSLQFVTPF